VCLFEEMGKLWSSFILKRERGRLIALFFGDLWWLYRWYERRQEYTHHDNKSLVKAVLNS